MSIYLEKHQAQFDKTIEHLREDLSGLRGDRANPAVVEKITVEAYGSITPLNGLAAIQVQDARTLIVQPWDKSIIKDIERAIQASDLGINPVNEGTQLRLAFPSLTEEKRKDLIKIVHEKLEEGRIAIRGVREMILKEVKKAKEDKEIGEDRFFMIEKEVQKKVDQYNEMVKEIGEKKEKELLTV